MATPAAHPMPGAAPTGRSPARPCPLDDRLGRWARLLPLTLLAACAAPVVPELPAPSAPGLILLIHGGGDDASVWAEGAVAPVTEALAEPARWDVMALDWAADADSKLTAARRGRRIGEALAEQVETAGYDDVHLIAHSVGAHLAHALALGLSEEPTVQLTLLDPFVGSGLVRWGYGRGRFGSGTDFAEAVVNRDDGVPSSDGLLDEAHVFDVTATRPSALLTSQEGHRWPITWYLQSAGSGLGLDLALGAGGEDLWDSYPPGEASLLGGS
ncbi:MAG: alpha/beta fold hydrolase [Deltaproteobacteria bacterium]|nr:alpha/beta fold hydrolase [Deltaproteobacteria bacterium]